MSEQVPNWDLSSTVEENVHEQPHPIDISVLHEPHSSLPTFHATEETNDHLSEVELHFTQSHLEMVKGESSGTKRKSNELEIEQHPWTQTERNDGEKRGTEAKRNADDLAPGGGHVVPKHIKCLRK
ncbi:unnamed protein product [Ilex paraguariensis]|uniref:Uncharacterized protein n=1 Tax=Ilex paraguariensis TaxID=185542 RepID=A0ABC8R5Q0_9AQUA